MSSLGAALGNFALLLLIFAGFLVVGFAIWWAWCTAYDLFTRIWEEYVVGPRRRRAEQAEELARIRRDAGERIDRLHQAFQVASDEIRRRSP
ncbi:hypothetical protein EK0264_04125 [Epidermidibacterium keratini]|uniref:Uncharacterized protein n=1 Tax=Epidermidibacterium keratini TaxID=1891644 RepID=A0A7L4YKF3_9ACTN|nr:hypothetical protein [Epidermidibacterium keratini]QHB99551.1 hypothetical protein EK0264_04125 [Epidermidibacterium keratini]